MCDIVTCERTVVGCALRAEALVVDDRRHQSGHVARVDDVRLVSARRQRSVQCHSAIGSGSEAKRGRVPFAKSASSTPAAAGIGFTSKICGELYLSYGGRSLRVGKRETRRNANL